MTDSIRPLARGARRRVQVCLANEILTILDEGDDVIALIPVRHGGEGSTEVIHQVGIYAFPELSEVHAELIVWTSEVDLQERKQKQRFKEQVVGRASAAPGALRVERSWRAGGGQLVRGQLLELIIPCHERVGILDDAGAGLAIFRTMVLKVQGAAFTHLVEVWAT